MELQDLPHRGDVALQSGTRDSIFLLQSRRWQINHEGIPEELDSHPDGGFVVLDTQEDEEPEYLDMADVAKRWPNHVYEEWRTVSVWFTREEATQFAEATHYRYEEGWRVYCVCAEGELAKLLAAVTAKPGE